ncbi:hypothetical protein L1887_22520 [Cichorium endivia]|nr:hypothetical protein L1887_22520 [Cichorium endivia]
MINIMWSTVKNEGRKSMETLLRQHQPPNITILTSSSSSTINSPRFASSFILLHTQFHPKDTQWRLH